MDKQSSFRCRIVNDEVKKKFRNPNTDQAFPFFPTEMEAAHYYTNDSSGTKLKNILNK